jgi:hypothetical protein
MDIAKGIEFTPVLMKNQYRDSMASSAGGGSLVYRRLSFRPLQTQSHSRTHSHANFIAEIFVIFHVLVVVVAPPPILEITRSTAINRDSTTLWPYLPIETPIPQLTVVVVQIAAPGWMFSLFLSQVLDILKPLTLTYPTYSDGFSQVWCLYEEMGCVKRTIVPPRDNETGRSRARPGTLTGQVRKAQGMLMKSSSSHSAAFCLFY